jgi:cytochrome oxidase Cu insertion factor (SCO1/SenC/PrrC family)
MRLTIAWIGVTLWLSAAWGQQTAAKLENGMLAPDFSVPDHNGNTVHLKDFLGKKAVLLAFYPKADTPG